MANKNLNRFIAWWMTPKLPYQDIFDLPLLKNKGSFSKYLHLISHWMIHPIKRRVARWYIKKLQQNGNIKIIGITGSAGKSTTTKMLESILSKNGNTVATPAGIDPVFNIPNTILKCRKNTKYLILEMSVEYPGEMDYYLWLVKPDIAVITNILASHLEFFKNLDGVLKEKGKLALSINKQGAVFLNDGDKKLVSFSKSVDSKVFWFKGDIDPTVQNSNAAKAVSAYLELEDRQIEAGLKDFKTPEHRLEIKKIDNNITILDDSYNSNPYAALSAIKYFISISKNKRKVAVMGDMLQMGDFDKKAHEMVGAELSKHDFEVVVGVGEMSAYMLAVINKQNSKIKTYLTKDVQGAEVIVKKHLRPGTYLLVKGSRSIGLDKLVDKLT